MSRALAVASSLPCRVPRRAIPSRKTTSLADASTDGPRRSRAVDTGWARRTSPPTRSVVLLAVAEAILDANGSQPVRS
jgi:hypothetical protein